jgi:four helix bundle protein
MARNYQQLIVWQKAMDLVAEVYRVSRGLPKEEQFGLSAQIRRAAISVPSNIAEGEGRGLPKEFVHFLRIAHGSLREVETQLMLMTRLGYADETTIDVVLDRCAEVGRLVNGLRKSIKE